MSYLRGHLWVNPDGVRGVGGAYGEHQGEYQSYLDGLITLRVNNANSWGDDDLGLEFARSFLAGLDNLESMIGGVIGQLMYTSNGLRTSGKLYHVVDEEAAEVGEKMARNFESVLPPGTGVLPPVIPGTRGSVLAGRQVVDGQEPPGLFMRSERLAVQLPVEPTLPLGSRRPVEHPVTHPLLSTAFSKPEFGSAYVAGKPLPQGYRLLALNPLADGAAYVDANRYDRIVPLGNTPVTTANAAPIDPGGALLFVVKENPNIDPTAPGYEPLIMRYSADGTPSVVASGR